MDVLDHGSMTGFPSYSEASVMLDHWVVEFPDVLYKERIGASYQERNIYAYVLGARRGKGNVGVAPAQVLITSLMHAREPAGLTTVLYFLGRMLELYDKQDPEALYVVQSREIWIVPFVNPDGYLANEVSLDRMIRKNQRPTCSGRPEESGVDINRNFGVHWRAAYPNCTEEYEGTEPFSEPETQAIKHVVEINNFRSAVNFHTFGDMLTHPCNWWPNTSSPLPLDDQHIYDELADIYGFKTFGSAFQTVGYTTQGESDDWLYAEKGIISMSPEVGPESGSFWPPAPLIRGIATQNFERLLHVAEKAGLELSIFAVRRPLASLATSNPTFLAEAGRLNGGLPRQGYLEITFGNTGLNSSGSLGVAVAGISAALPSSSDHPAGVGLVAAGDVIQKASYTIADGQQSALTFLAPPLARRSRSALSLCVGAAAELRDVVPLRFCVAEAPQVPIEAAAWQPLCQCGELELHGASDETPPDLHHMASRVRDLTYVRGNDGERGHLDWRVALCAAAAKTATGREDLPGALPTRSRVLWAPPIGSMSFISKISLGAAGGSFDTRHRSVRAAIAWMPLLFLVIGMAALRQRAGRAHPRGPGFLVLGDEQEPRYERAPSQLPGDQEALSDGISP